MADAIMKEEFQKANGKMTEIENGLVNAQEDLGLNETAKAVNELRCAAQAAVRFADHVMSMAVVLEHSI